MLVSGTVFNEKGAPVDSAVVTVQSLDASVPYAATAQTTEGAYAFTNIPEGIIVEITATKPGFTTRTRVQAFQTSIVETITTTKRVHALQTSPAGHILDFGGQEGSGRASFISDYPEVVSTTPADGQTGLEPTKLAFKVTLSEPIDEDSRDGFENAFAIVPTSAESSINETATVIPHFDVATAEANGSTLANVTVGRFAYALKERNTFLGSSTNKVNASWNIIGDQVTFTFEGNLQTGRDASGKYQAVLFTPSIGTIEDPFGNRLGTNATGNRAWPPAGDLLCNAFKATELAYDGTPGQAWAQTHTSAVRFEVRNDAVAPKLTGIEMVEDDQDLRIEMVFSEPLAAYVGTSRAHIDPSVFDLRSYSFMVGQKSGDLTNEELDGIDTLLVGGTIGEMKAKLSPKREFQFDHVSRAGYAVASGGDLDQFPGANVVLEVEPDAPNIVNIWLRGGAGPEVELFSGYRSIKARAYGIKDPAGNPITVTNADKNLVSASI